MSPNHLLPVLLIGSGLVIPILYFISSYLNKGYKNKDYTNVIAYWLYFLLSVLAIRIIAGLVLSLTNIDLPGIAKFYPIRIAYPNYDLLKGAPYVLICLIILARFNKIQVVITQSKLKYLLIWIFSVILLLCFGGIHGGLITGNAWMATAMDHITDAHLNNTVSDLFATHVNRIMGLMKPNYQAPHSLSHPAASLAYWQWMLHYTTPFFFSVINVMLFSLALPTMYWALRRFTDDATAIPSTLLCLIIPALLIYGRSDDAVYYAFASITFSLLSVAIKEKNYLLTILASILFVVAMNLSYAAIVLLPILFTFNAAIQLNQIMQYIRQVIPHLLILFFILIIALLMEQQFFHYNWLAGFMASVHHNQGSNILSMIKRGLYIRAISDRIMVFYDFLIFAGPFFLYLFITLIKNKKKIFTNWQVKNIALVILLLILAINSNGPGEVARPWGSLFILIGFSWFPELINKNSALTSRFFMGIQFSWALVLQVFLNFSW